MNCVDRPEFRAAMGQTIAIAETAKGPGEGKRSLRDTRKRSPLQAGHLWVQGTVAF